jgi:hypothetical protein
MRKQADVDWARRNDQISCRREVRVRISETK